MVFFNILISSLREGLSNLSWYCRSWSLYKVAMLMYYYYLLNNPYRICRLYMSHCDDERVQTVYGETPFNTFKTISVAAKLSSADTVYELGCGRGLGVFWLAAMVGCKSIGIDVIPDFINKAQRIKKIAGIHQAEFIQSNLFDTDLSAATLIYLYGSAFTDEVVEKLIDYFTLLTPGTLIASVSYPLTDYAQPNEYTVIAALPVHFLWGDTTVYLQRKN